MALEDPGCSRCRAVITERLAEFASENQIAAGNPIVWNFLYSEIERCFPGLLDLIQNPAQWIEQFGAEWFPVSPERLTNEKLHVEIVTAPLPFTAAVVRVVCTDCGLSHRIVHLGANFYVMTCHLSAFFIQRGLSATGLAQFIGELMTVTPEWDAVPPPRHVPREIVAAAMAWIFCHEVGHIANPDPLFTPKLDLPAYAKRRVRDELNADHRSFQMLMHRQQAFRPLGREGPCILLGGVSLLLRAWNGMISKSQGRQIGIHAYGSRVGAATPSPTLRWTAAKSVFDTLVRLGGASEEDYDKLERLQYADAEAKTDHLWRRMDEHGITF